MKKRKAFLTPLLFVIGIFSILTIAGLTVNYLSASSDGEPEPESEPIDVVDPETPESVFHCHVEIRDDLHQVNAFFAIVETYPGGDWPAVETKSHTAETLAYSLIQVRGLSVPSQFTDRTRTLIFSERERERFDKAMSFVWALISQAETLLLRNPQAVEGGYVICDVSLKIGGHELDLAKMLIADGHARPAGIWDWGARDVYEITE